ncbi:Altered inheritance of mitochondria protein 24, mitochondrial [Elasticomyces elasticus]|nr:Altered inheritance of mitochondria protein 24, mitochondrial [Elasticomyces elasticus]
MLEYVPLKSAILGLPLFYQKVSSTTPFTALLSTKSTATSFAVVHLDGRLDWMVAQRNGLLAWTGHTLSLVPKFASSMSWAYWGNCLVTGRGLIALNGKGQIYQVTLKSGEEYVAHPSHVLAYATMQHPPQPYRFKSSSLRFQVPSVTTLLPDTRFFQSMRASGFWQFVANSAYTIRTWARRSIWGDRLFLHFHGPANILLQSRGAPLTDMFTKTEVNELADAPAGAVPAALTLKQKKAGTMEEGGEGGGDAAPVSQAAPVKMSFASVGKDGKVVFEDKAT